MDAGRALTDLVEVSSQIEGAVLLGPDGGVEASTWPDAARGERVAKAARALVETADVIGSKPPTQLHAATAEGDVFCVREGERVVAAVTKSDPTVGLVYYDLRTCLRLAAEDAPKKPSKARARKPKAKAEEATSDA